MNTKCIITQVHIPDFDVQGKLEAQDKLKLVNFGLKHLRAFNPDSYIILSGHGSLRPDVSLCDFAYWEPKCRPLDRHGYVIGMPAQYYFVYQGLLHAKSKGYDACLKTRGDCVIGIRDVATHCDDILKSETKRLLITQQTGDKRMGDCFMYGDLDLLIKIWHGDNEVVDPDGLINTARHFKSAVGGNNLLEDMRRHCSFRDVDELKFTCLRWNYRQLNCLDGDAQNRILKDAFPFEKWHWGKTNGWCRFHPNRECEAVTGFEMCRKEFYK